jgi:dihydroxyacetone kinase-like predicted kinase
MKYLNGQDLYQMFNYGTNFVVKKRKQLNDINVFQSQMVTQEII